MFILVRAKKALRPAGGENCIILHQSACTGVDTSVAREEGGSKSLVTDRSWSVWWKDLACVMFELSQIRSLELGPGASFYRPRRGTGVQGLRSV